jgi:hypothetical protein
MSRLIADILLVIILLFAFHRIDELQKQVKELKFRVECLECCPHYPPCVYDEIDPDIYERAEPPEVEHIAITNLSEGVEHE